MVNGPEDVLDWDAVVWRVHEDQRSQAAEEDLQGDAGTGLGHGPVSAEDGDLRQGILTRPATREALRRLGDSLSGHADDSDDGAAGARVPVPA